MVRSAQNGHILHLVTTAVALELDMMNIEISP